MSIQRTVLIIFVLRLFVFTAIIALIGGQAYNVDNYLGGIDKVKTDNRRIQDYLLQSNLDTDNTYTQQEIGSSQIGFEASIWDYLSGGLLGWANLNWARDNFEKNFLLFLNLINLVITLIAGYEIFQIIWGKKTT